MGWILWALAVLALGGWVLGACFASLWYDVKHNEWDKDHGRRNQNREH